MADSKITALTALTAADPINDMLPIVDVSDTTMAASGTTKKISVNNILGASGTATLASATITGAATVGTTLGVTGASTLTGNVSVGTTLSAWGGNSKVVEVGVGSAVSSTGAGTTSSRFTHGCYFDNTNWKYQYTSVGATLYEVTGANSGSTHAWYVAPGGTAGNTVTAFTAPAMTLSYATGNLAFPTGKGIDFSAVTGGTGTATANVLNDYEEGQFTPTISSGATAVTYSVQYGRYTKVGRLVTVYAQITTTAATRDANQFIIGGLPFSAAVIGSGAIGYSNSGFISTAGGNKPNLYVSGSAVEFYNSAGGSFAGTTIASDAFDIRFSATYFA